MVILVKFSGKFVVGNITTFIPPFKFIRTFSGTFRLIALLPLLLFRFEFVSAGFERTAQPSRILGTAMSSLFGDDPESALLNPSSICGLRFVHTSIFCSPSPFELPQLGSGGVMVAAPSGPIDLAATLSSTGFSLYKEFTATATLGMGISEGFTVGCNINFNRLTIERYGSAWIFGIDVGATLEVAEGMHWGFSMLNLNRPSLSGIGDQLPQSYITGAAFTLLPSASLSISLMKDPRYPLSEAVGVEFSPHELLTLRFGVSTEPSRYFAGVGLHVGSIGADYSVATHAELGLTHSFEISFEL